MMFYQEDRIARRFNNSSGIVSAADFSDTFGSISRDSVRSNYLTVSGGCVRRKLPLGKSIRINNSQNQFLTANSNSVDFTSSDFSGVMLLHLHSYNATADEFFVSGTALVKGWQLFGVNGLLTFRTIQSGTYQSTSSVSGAYRLNRHILVGFSRSGSNADVYVNGRNVTSSHATHINPVSGNTFYIGAYGGSPTYGLNGDVFFYRIFNRYLSESEHMLLYKNIFSKMSAGMFPQTYSAPTFKRWLSLANQRPIAA